MRNKIIGIGLASCMMLSGVAFADGNSKEEIKNVTTVIEEKVDLGIEDSEYIAYEGTIKEVIKTKAGDKDKESLAVVVESDEEEGHKSIRFNLSNGTLLLSNKTMNSIKGDKLEEGMKVSVHYNKNEPMTRSLPPQLSPTVLVLLEADKENLEEHNAVKVAKFDENLVSIDNNLKLNVDEKTDIVDINGEELSAEDIKNRDLVVFYGPIVTMSIPAQSGANKIIVLNPNVKVLDKLVIDKKEINLENKMFKSVGYTMLPLRELAEKLEYKVSWNNGTKSVVLTKGNQEIQLVVGEDQYSFAKSIVKLGKASEVIDGNTYVPLDFVEKVLKLDLNVSENGIINISQK